jgi:PIN domain nuclease of toxin-antitoxin system
MGSVTDGYLLDTHAVLWVLTEPTRLSDRVRPVLANRSYDLYVSTASAWEIATKHRRGKLPQADAVIGGYERHLRRAEVETIPIGTEHALLGGGLEWINRDPFDRVIAATAMVEGLPLVTDDGAFASLNGIRTFW